MQQTNRCSEGKRLVGIQSTSGSSIGIKIKIEPTDDNNTGVYEPVIQPHFGIQIKKEKPDLKYEEEMTIINRRVQSGSHRQEIKQEPRDDETGESKPVIKSETDVECNFIDLTQDDCIDAILKTHIKKAESASKEELIIIDHQVQDSGIKENPKGPNYGLDDLSSSFDDSNCDGDSSGSSLLWWLLERTKNGMHKDAAQLVWPYRCTNCAYGSIYPSELKRHMLIHIEDKHKCTLCSFKSNTASNLKTHMVIHAKKHNPLKCNDCSYRCIYPSQLKRHMFIHIGDKHKCTLCSFKSNTASNLKTHMVVHAKHKPLKCNDCSYRCIYPSQLKRHMFIHIGDKHKCTLCSFKSNTASNLKTHMVVHAKHNPLKCNDCSYRCIYPSQLKGHMLIHIGDKHKCTLCSFRSNTVSNLKTHMVIHAKDKPLIKCNDCPYSCIYPFALKKHMWIHIGDKPSCAVKVSAAVTAPKRQQMPVRTRYTARRASMHQAPEWRHPSPWAYHQQWHALYWHHQTDHIFIMNNRRQYRPQNRFSINSSPMGPYQHRYSGNKNQFGPNNFNSDSTRMGIQDSNLLDPHRTPLQKRTTTGFNDSPRPRPYISDELIVNRVAKYLDKYGRNHRVDYNQMAIDLQQEYPDLKRRKRAALKYHLHKAVAILEVERGLNADESEVIDDDEEEVIEEDDDNDLQSDDPRGRKSPEFAFEGDGDVNSALENSYLQNAKRSKLAQSGGAQELINIVSSDEDEAEAETPDTTQAQKGTAAGTEPQKAPEEQKSEKTSANTAVVQEAPSTDVRAKKRRVAYKAAHLEAGAKKFKASLQPVNPTVSFKDIGGSEKVLQDVTQLLIHMRHPEVYKTLGVCPPRGFLLHGPPGSGKTLLANAIAGELSVPLLKVTAPELVGGLSGQSEQQIRELFSQAEALAPCVLFIDEIDAITPHRETAHREMERRIVAQLLSSMDELSATESGQRVLVLGATNRPDALDPALRRAGRFDREVCLGIPDRDARQSILQTLSGSLRLDPGLDLAHVAAMTPGFVGADLKSLVTEAAIAAVNRLFKTLHEEKCKETLTIKESKNEDKENVMEVDVGPAPGEEEIKILDSITKEEKEKQIPVVTMDEEGEKTTTDTVEKTDDGGKEVAGVAVAVAKLDNEDDGSQDVQVVHVKTPSLLHSPPFTAEQLKGVYISVADFEVALKTVQPSAKREGFATVPDVRWEDIGSLQDIRHELTMAILAPVRHPRQFAAMGLSSAATGVMLCGPPGCGKTLLAKAVANEAGINFISVKGPELLNMYVGESERAVRQCFQRARSSQPCVIFFDEIDALCPKRSGIESGATRVVNQLLTEMDGVESRTGVFLMAATNRPDIVDPAVMRPGRLDKVLYVGMPAAQDRIDILGALTKGGRRPVLGEDVDLAAVANDPRCEGYTGADLAALVREASLEVLRELVARERDDDTLQATPPVCARHFHTALARIRPSVSDKDKKRYEDLRLQYAAVPSTG